MNPVIAVAASAVDIGGDVLTVLTPRPPRPRRHRRSPEVVPREKYGQRVCRRADESGLGAPSAPRRRSPPCRRRSAIASGTERLTHWRGAPHREAAKAARRRPSAVATDGQQPVCGFLAR
jgi:hypothetical protein